MPEALPQLYMRKPSMDDLPPLVLPEGMGIVTHTDELVPVWEGMIETIYGAHFSFEKTIIGGGDYAPERVLYLTDHGRYIATATAVEKDIFPGEGWFRMVGTLPDARGRGAGSLICTAALHALKKRGFPSTVLSTDDFRLPAIRMYLRLGFEPLMTHESHAARWEAVLQELKKR